MSLISQHQIPEQIVDRTALGREFRGFFMSRDLAADPDIYWAYYTDAVFEQINPITGKPRPDPDPADRTKFLKIDASALTARGYTGLMKLVVQCYFSQGKPPPFRAGFEVTHGVFESPFPRVVGATPEEEATLAASRRFWLVEISSAGVYAAPMALGGKCVGCVSLGNLTSFKPEGEDHVSLAWAFVNANPLGRIVRLLDDSDMAPAYADSAKIAAAKNVAWAFSYSGRKAANVTLRFHDNADFGLKKYTGQLFEIAIAEADGVLSATLTAGTEKNFNNYRAAAMYPEPAEAPVIEHWRALEWAMGGSGPTYTPNPDIGVQDTPLYVYYTGETRVLARWILEPFTDEENPAITHRYGFTAGALDNFAYRGGGTQDGVPMMLVHANEREAIGFLFFPSPNDTPDESIWRLMARSESHVQSFTSDIGALTIVGNTAVGGLPDASNFLVAYHTDPGFPATRIIESTLYAAAGALFYDDPRLDPVNQKANYVRRFGGEFTSVGGFLDVDADEDPISFVGKV